jgi:hypothetical protein
MQILNWLREPIEFNNGLLLAILLMCFGSFLKKGKNETRNN